MAPLAVSTATSLLNFDVASMIVFAGAGSAPAKPAVTTDTPAAAGAVEEPAAAPPVEVEEEPAAHAAKKGPKGKPNPDMVLPENV